MLSGNRDARLEFLGVVLETYRKACANYFLRPYSGRLALVQPLEDVAAQDRENDWRAVANELEVYQAPGGHFSALTTNVRVLADVLKGCLSRARRDMPSISGHNGPS